MDQESSAFVISGGKMNVATVIPDVTDKIAFTSNVGRQRMCSGEESPHIYEETSECVQSATGTTNDMVTSDEKLQDISCSTLVTNVPTLISTQDETHPPLKSAGSSSSEVLRSSDAAVNDSTSSESKRALPTAERSQLDKYLSKGISESDLRLLRKEEPEDAIFLLQLITDGRLVPGDSGVSRDSRPAWVDTEKIHRGQQFAQKYYFCLGFAEMLSLLTLFSPPAALEPFIFTGNSDTPFKAFRRYLSTGTRVHEWYKGDLWAPNGGPRKHLHAVRQLHAFYRKRLNDAQPAELMRKTTLQPPLWTRTAAEDMRADFGAVAPGGGCPFYDAITNRQEWINQMEMAVTQMGFMGLVIAYPDRFGVGWATKEELEGFVHLWHVLGYLLGIEERFNMCAGGLEVTRRRIQMFYRVFLLPTMARVDAAWEHMTRCVIEGVRLIGGRKRLSYEVALAYLCATVGVATPRASASLSAKERRDLRILTLVLRWVPRVPPLRAMVNWDLRRVVARAQTLSPQQLRELQARVYDYERVSHSSDASPARVSSSKPFVDVLSLGCARTLLYVAAKCFKSIGVFSVSIAASFALFAVVTEHCDWR